MIRLLVALALCSALACKDAAETPPGPTLAVAPAPSLLRLTKAQYRNSVRDLLGSDLAFPATLEPDAEADGLATVGGSVASLSPRGVELYEGGAQSLAAQMVATPERLATLVSCDSEGCVRELVERFGRRAWRRPLEGAEVDRLMAIGAAAKQKLGRHEDAVAWILTAMLESPHFLYRQEPAEGGRLDGYAFAARLAAFLWASTPDDALLDAAASGALDGAEGLAREVDRLLADPRARDSVTTFVTEWLQLQRLDQLNKDPKVFKHYSSDLGAMAREETVQLALWLVFDQKADLGDLLTTRTTFVNRRLAAIYNIPAPVLDDSFARVELPADGERRGFLGQASFLALYAHAVSTSATKRGVFIREALLCQTMPPPPSDLNTAIPEPSAKAVTLRDRMVSHRTEKVCSGCHSLSDPIGLAFERFDGVGRFRLEEGGALIDPADALDGKPFADFPALAALLAADPRFTRCAVRKLFAYAVGHPLGEAERELTKGLAADFTANGRRLLWLMRTIALAPAFRQTGEIQ